MSRQIVRQFQPIKLLAGESVIGRRKVIWLIHKACVEEYFFGRAFMALGNGRAALVAEEARAGSRYIFTKCALGSPCHVFVRKPY